MPKVVTPITAVVEHITGVKDGQYGPYRSVLFKVGEEKIWKSFDPDSEELEYLTKGTRVQLVPTTSKSGKESHQIVILDQAPQATPPNPRPQQSQASTQALPPATGMSPETKRAIAAYVDEQADLLAFCWKTAQAKLAEHDPSEESIRCAASTLYIAAQRQFRI